MPPLLIQARDLAQLVMVRHNSEHIHLSKAETELLAYGVLKPAFPDDAYVQFFEKNSMLAPVHVERPPLGKEPYCTCGHLVSDHEAQDPGRCFKCDVCNGFERVKVGNDDPIDGSKDANSRQVGGSHYGLKNFQHWDLVALFKLDYFQGQITKYVMRWKQKNGVQDLEKALHFLEKYIELEKQGKLK